MSDWQRFGATGEAGTCIWCGRALRRERYKIWHDDPLPSGFRWTDKRGETPGGMRWRLAEADVLGGYQDGVFCGLRCGYLFGKRMAELGKRLQARD